jgi:hypothetical protein
LRTDFATQVERSAQYGPGSQPFGNQGAAIMRASGMQRNSGRCSRNRVRADGIEPRYEAGVAEPLGMTLQILFGVVGMSMWLTP